MARQRIFFFSCRPVIQYNIGRCRPDNRNISVFHNAQIIRKKAAVLLLIFQIHTFQHDLLCFPLRRMPIQIRRLRRKYKLSVRRSNLVGFPGIYNVRRHQIQVIIGSPQKIIHISIHIDPLFDPNFFCFFPVIFRLLCIRIYLRLFSSGLGIYFQLLFLV